MAEQSVSDSFFPDLDKAKYGESRRHRALFIPEQLEAAGLSLPMSEHKDPQKAAAFSVISRWASLARAGELAGSSEQTLKPEFLTQVFGQALGFVLRSEAEGSWNLWQEYPVNGGHADAAIGTFSRDGQDRVRALVEMKGPSANLDKDRTQGRTPVQQCWDYLNAVPDCPWGVVSNFVSIRIYHRDHTPRVYELFLLEELSKPDAFDRFYYVLSRDGLLPGPLGGTPRIDELLQRTGRRQIEVGDELYELYHAKRVALIRHLESKPFSLDLDTALRVAQKLLDRVLFIAFCEDRGLLPADTIARAYSSVPPFTQLPNPRWRNFRDLFKSIDAGHAPSGIPPFNGGLFRQDDVLDRLELEDEWTELFRLISGYDFRDEVSVEVLGHIFEESVRDLERIRLGGLFGTEVEAPPRTAMPKSAERRRQGVYYTPAELTDLIVGKTVAVIADQALVESARETGCDPLAETLTPTAIEEFASAAVSRLRSIKVVDPACGSGAFLIQAYDALDERYQFVADLAGRSAAAKARELEELIPRHILRDNLHGVDLSPEAIEIARLSLWIRSARKGRSLDDLSMNLVCGNSLVDDPSVDGMAVNWAKAFPAVLGLDGRGFDCVIGNPPWERVKLQEREFFSEIVPEVAAAVNAADRARLVKALQKDNPELWDRYLVAQERAEAMAKYARESGRFPTTCGGDVNYYALFAELAMQLLSRTGRIGILLPSGIATDQSTSHFFSRLVEENRLVALYDFENKAPLFADVHKSMKFSALFVSGEARPQAEVDFVFFAHRASDLSDRARHVALSAKDISLVNPNTKTCPIFRSNGDAQLTTGIYRRVPVLVHRTGADVVSPWGVRFCTMFHQTNDAALFKTGKALQKAGYKLMGAVWKKGKKTFLPLYEAKMVQAYDHRAASVLVKEANWMRQGQKETTTLAEHADPSFSVLPRWWVPHEAVAKRVPPDAVPAHLVFKDVTSPTNTRTMIAAFIPYSGVLNSAPIIRVQQGIGVRQQCCLLANLNALALDFIARQKVGGLHLNFFVVEQLPILPPSIYDQPSPWTGSETLLDWLSARVLALTCTSHDMRALAVAAGLGDTHEWDENTRIDTVTSIDAAFFILYGLVRREVEQVLDGFQGVDDPQERLLDSASVRARILRHFDRMRAC